ncbi:contractile injection system tape measure protein [Pseudomonas shirazensis]
MDKNKHSIQKVFLEVETPSMAMANAIKNNLALFVQNELILILENQFNLTQNTNNQIVQIEKIAISIDSDTGKNGGFLSNNETKNDIKNQIDKEIYKALSALKKSQNDDENVCELRIISPHEKELKTLLYFIENGSMPWWISKDDAVLFFEKINFENITKDVFKIDFRNLIRQKSIQKRIINQFTNSQIALLTSTLLNSETQQKAFEKNNVIQFLNNNSQSFKTSFWQLLFDALSGQNPIKIIRFYHQNQTEFTLKEISLEHYIQNLKAFFPLNISVKEYMEMNSNYLKPESSNEKEIKESSTDNEDNFKDDKNNSKSCYVQNAGLIILHPFLKEMLTKCDLMGENNTILNKEMAAHILHYTATKRENDYEHAMVFEKFLCGIPMHHSIERQIRIEDKHKRQVEEMLLSVVEHWSALKNTSTAILRSEFLQREGKLDWSETNPKLAVERKTQDLLLEKIPWNINIVKIPWMEKLIYTQW